MSGPRAAPVPARWLAVVGLTLAGGARAADDIAETLALRLDDGRELAAELRLPAGASGRVPAIMLFGGFRNAATVLDRVHSERPLAWASFDYPFAAPRKFEFPQSLKLAPEMRAAIHGSFDGIGKLYAALMRHPRIDPARITVVGGSAGAPFATVGAARHGIPGLILVQGFAKPRTVIHHQFMRKYGGRWWSGLASGPLWLLSGWIVWYCELPDIAAHARRLTAPQKVLMVTADEDDFIPEEASTALWRALANSAAQVEQMPLPGRHLRASSAEQIADILQRSLAWMEKSGLL